MIFLHILNINCQGWARNKIYGVCYLKSQIEEVEDNPDWDSGTKCNQSQQESRGRLIVIRKSRKCFFRKISSNWSFALVSVLFGRFVSMTSWGNASNFKQYRMLCELTLQCDFRIRTTGSRREGRQRIGCCGDNQPWDI